jgi:hypothetical protein
MPSSFLLPSGRQATPFWSLDMLAQTFLPTEQINTCILLLRHQHAMRDAVLISGAPT